MAAKGEIHLDRNKTWMQCHLSRIEEGDKTHQITWIWSLTSLDFALSWMNDFTASSSSLPPASNPGESWKMNSGLLSKENSSWTSWIPFYRIRVNGLIREMRKGHRVSTFWVGLICRWRDDKSGVSSEADILHHCKLGPSLSCKPA